MTRPFPIIFASHLSLTIALSLLALMILISIIKRLTSALKILPGATLLALAAGTPTYSHPTDGSIAVMVDLSPSTRTATFRNNAALQLRIHQLLGPHPYQIYAFSDHNEPLPKIPALPDFPCDQTQFNPSAADAILLFSDGQFEPPATAPPTYPVIDPILNHPKDSAITQLQFLDHQILATVKNPNRPLTWVGATPSPVTPGEGRGEGGLEPQQTLATPTTNSQITATLVPKDPWPENDFLSITPITIQKQKWWIGPNPPANWTSTTDLPTSPTDYLQPAIIALNNIPADNLSTAQQTALLQYVRDLGGSLIIIGGNQAFAAGHYDSSTLEDLSPLSSSPPLPTQTWLILIDASGSMAGDPWNKELAILNNLLPQLPPHDQITFASFAKSLFIWPETKPPQNIFPTGPTNLAPALQQISDATNPASPTQLLLISDADTDLPNPTQLTKFLNQKNIHLHLLAIGNGKALPALQQIASQTHGSVIQQLDIAQWPASAEQLLRSALPDRYQHTKVQPAPAPPAEISNWNTTWLKPHATALQTSTTTPLVARWQFGLGQVISIAYPAPADIANTYANQIAIPPQDPRFKIKLDQSAQIQISIDAAQNSDYLNNQTLTAELNNITTPVPQTAPGQYHLALPAPGNPAVLSLFHDQQLLNRFPIAGRYPPEFNAIGNNLENLKKLATQTGGQVIPPGPVSPINFRWPSKQVHLTSPCTFAGFLMIASGMILPRKTTSKKMRTSNIEQKFFTSMFDVGRSLFDVRINYVPIKEPATPAK